MNRITLLGVLGLVLIAMVITSCGKKEEPIVEEPVQVVEEPVMAEPESEPEPPPPAPKMKESQFKTVYFDFDKFNLRTDAKAALDFNFNLLNEFPDAIIKIEGHCDERGTVEYNLSLGEKRAKSAMDYLTGLGINPARLSIISYGKERPVDAAHNEAAWSKNRRAEFKIISQ